MDGKTVNIISTFAGLLPFIAGVIVIKKAAFNHRVLILFLLYGFLTDFLVWQLMTTHIIVAKTIFFMYSLMESVFFGWFIYYTSTSSIIRKASVLLMLLAPAGWIIAFIDFSNAAFRDEPADALFSTVYLIIAALLSSWSILNYTRQEKSLAAIPDFWFLTGLFFYSFSVFFVSALMQTQLLHNVWFLHNILNIITYLIFVYGFLKVETGLNLQEKQF